MRLERSHHRLRRLRGGARAGLAFLHRLRDRNGSLSATPSRRTHPITRLCPGLLALALTVASGCAPERDVPIPDRELRGALGLDDQRTIHRITLGGRGAVEHVAPPELRVREGDLVQFVTVDRRVHVVRFEGEALSDQAARFLEAGGQRASPPLIHSGSRFVVTFENAPVGSYPFVSVGHGDPAPGVIFVEDRASDSPPPH